MSSESTKASYGRYYEKNKKARNDSSRSYQQSNKEKCGERRRERYRERLLEDPSFRLRENKRHLDYFADYRPRNLEKVNLWSKRWRAKNRDKTQIYSFRRKSRKMTAEHDIEKCNQFYTWVRNQDFVSCTYCGTFVIGKSVEIDHIVPLSRGGAHLPDNFCLSCRSCNASKGDSLLSEWPRCPDKFRFIQV